MKNIIYLITFTLSLPLFSKNFSYTKTTPINSKISNNIQGIAHNNKNFFISNIDHIYKLPISIKFNNSTFNPSNLSKYQQITIPKKFIEMGYHHFGGITVHKSYVVVALERIKPMKLLFFDTNNLELKKQYDVPFEFDSLSWVASDETHLYFSENQLNSNQLLYKLNPKTEKISSIKINGVKRIKRIQGGTIDKLKNELYLASDGGMRKGGVFKINLNNFFTEKVATVRYLRFFPVYQEIEGLTLLPRKNGSSSTEFYLLLLNNNLFKDTFRVLHLTKN